ncbi:similar to Saccharomyces cerevisiae YBL029W Non-essential protein of unknown function [Maudiozyma saulgeensis]|uniref:Uncharacterized protein n=1 Tax=Maudiozyma saulgeensis TaxID=1789683 RepID=A0A1X7R449_9SACH|nr:similar to Saccharomyces cerevisiae YBL029W Non-essential protein of unknown function [Kazachstania saulgeensis]
MPFQNIENFSLSENEMLNQISLDSPINYLNSYNLNNNNINLQQDIINNENEPEYNIFNNLNNADDFELTNSVNMFSNFFTGVAAMSSYNMNEENNQLDNGISNSSFSSSISSESLSSLIEDHRNDNNASPISEENDLVTNGKNKILTSSKNTATTTTTIFNDVNNNSKITIEFPQANEENSIDDFLTPVSSITMSYDDLLTQNNLIFSTTAAASAAVTEKKQEKIENKIKNPKKSISKKKLKKCVHSHTIASITNNLKKVSDSRLSAQGLAQVLHLDSPEEALQREKYILHIFEHELHYPLGYKTWIRDTDKTERIELINNLYDRVKSRYPDYNPEILETIIRRATYYMMQSRLRRERRAKCKNKDQNE